MHKLYLDYSNFRLSRNILLEGDANERKKLGAFLVPSVMINGRRFSVGKIII
jgi:hypothetical protein